MTVLKVTIRGMGRNGAAGHNLSLPYCSLLSVFHRPRNKIATRCSYMPQSLACSFSLVALKFSIHNLFETRVLFLKRYLTSNFHYSYKCSISSHLIVKMASGNRDKAYPYMFYFEQILLE